MRRDAHVITRQPEWHDLLLLEKACRAIISGMMVDRSVKGVSVLRLF